MTETKTKKRENITIKYKRSTMIRFLQTVKDHNLSYKHFPTAYLESLCKKSTKKYLLKAMHENII